MRKRFQLFLWAIISIFGLGWSVNHTALAASMPNAVDVFVLPGEAAVVSIPVQNILSYSTEISFLPLAAVFDGVSDAPQLRHLSAEQLQLSVEPSLLTLMPGESRLVTVTVEAPRNALTGVTVLALVAQETLSGAIAVNHGAATLVFATVGYPAARGRCLGLRPISPDSGEISLVNDGSGILVPDGVIQLRGPGNFLIRETAVNGAGHRVLPEQSRTWSVPLPPIPWWAMGRLFYVVEDRTLSNGSCARVAAGSRWWPLFLVGAMTIGGAIIIRRQRHYHEPAFKKD